MTEAIAILWGIHARYKRDGQIICAHVIKQAIATLNRNGKKQGTKKEVQAAPTSEARPTGVCTERDALTEVRAGDDTAD